MGTGKPWSRRQIDCRGHGTVTIGSGVGLAASPQHRLEPPENVVVARRREAAERVEQVRVGPDEDARLAGLDPRGG